LHLAGSIVVDRKPGERKVKLDGWVIISSAADRNEPATVAWMRVVAGYKG
jgi:hypothetical protein